MLIAIISDIHDNLANLEKCLNWCQKEKIEKIICLGDVTTEETINYLAENFSGEIFLVAGNCEIYQEASLLKRQNINFGGEISLIELENLNIGLTHRPQEIKKILTLSPKKLDFIFNGHTHTPSLTNQDKTIIANPGNLAGVFHQATFAVLETKTKKLELKILHYLL